MTHTEFKAELDNREIRNSYKLTKWGSQYWTIDGVQYRMSDHRKPDGYFTSYVFGETDFSDYALMLNVVVSNVAEKDKVRHLSYEEREILHYGRYLQENQPKRFNNWVAYHPEFHELI